MGLLDAFKGASTGNKAYRVHVQGNKLADEGKPREAEEKYREALALYAEAVRRGTVASNLLRGYNVLLMRTGHFDEAHDLMLKMEKMPGLKPDDQFNLRLQFSIWQWKRGEYDKAIATLRRAVNGGMNGLTYSTLGMYLVDQAKQSGDFEEALKFNEEALDYDDEDAATLDNMGQLYEAMSRAEGEKGGERAAGYRQKAMDFYKKAHKARPRQITTLYYLARMYHEDGQDDKARALLANRDSLYVSAVCPVSRDQLYALAEEIG